MGFDEMLIPMGESGSNADTYFGDPIYKIRLHSEQLIKFSRFIGALIAYLLIPDSYS
jgi:hypothetical protein